MMEKPGCSLEQFPGATPTCKVQGSNHHLWMVQGKILQGKILYSDLYTWYTSHVLRKSLDILQCLDSQIHIKTDGKVNI